MLKLDINNPIMLDEKTAKQLKDMGTDIAILETEIARAKRAGIDMTDTEKKFNELKNLRLGLLREYTK